MTGRRLITGDWQSLHAAFITALSAQRKINPLARLDIIVPGPLARLALRRDLARAGCSHANVRFTTVDELTARIADPILKQRGYRRLREMTRQALMVQALRRTGPLRYFNELADREGFQRALWRTIGELRGAGFTPAQILQAARRLQSARNRVDLHRKLADIGALWSAISDEMRNDRFADSHDILEIAADQGRFDSAVPLVIYGLDNLTVLERRFMESAIAERDVSVYLPYADNAAFTWVKPLLSFFETLGLQRRAAEPLALDDAQALDTLQRHLFGGEGPSTPITVDDSLCYLSAPTREREAEEIVRRLLNSPRSNHGMGRRVGILLRESDPYARLLRDELGRAGVTGYFDHARPLRDTSQGQALLRFARLLDARFRRADVMDFLLSSPVKWPPALGTPLPMVPVAEWNHFSLLAGVTSGSDSWKNGLHRLRSQFEANRQISDDDDDTVAPGNTARKITSLRLMRAYLEHVFERVHAIRNASRYSDAAHLMMELFFDTVDVSSDTETISAAFEQADDLDRIGYPVTPENILAMVRAALGAPVDSDARFEQDEPTVASFARAQGVLFDEVLIPGLVEKEVPRPASQDPLLPDEERRVLRDFGLPDLPMREWGRDRERFLFHSAVTSAQARLVLSYPRRDATQARDRLPSTFLLDATDAITGRQTDYAVLDALIRQTDLGIFVSPGRLNTQSTPRPATVLQYFTQCIAEAVNGHSTAPLAALVLENSLFSRAVLAEQKRFRTSCFTPFDGLIGGAARASLQTAFLSSDALISATRMEHYAKCPFRYFTIELLEAETAEEEAELGGLDPLERGKLIHDILERFYKQELADGRLPLRDDAEQKLTAIARTRFRHFEEHHGVGQPVLWRIACDQILDSLYRLIATERADATRFIPAHFEVSYGNESPEDGKPNPPLQIQLPDGNTLRLRGRIDRIDLSPEGLMRIVDYKSGTVPTGSGHGRLSGGRTLQLPIYRLAAEMLLSLDADEAVYLYVKYDPLKVVRFSPDHWSATQSSFLFALQTIHDGMVNGRFYPFPDREECARCNARPACGSGRWTSKWNQAPADGEAFAQMRAIP